MELTKTLQKTLNRTNLKIDLYVDLAESITGILLVGFLWTHMFFVATIMLGQDVFNRLSEYLDKYYLSYIGVPFIICIIILHIFMAGRRAPLRLRDLRITWRHARMLGHGDTWIWVGQVITALLIGILASIHIWIIVTQWPIEALKSAARVNSLYFWFYIILLLVGEYHAGFGLYRIFVKWGWFKRRKVGYVLKAITLIIIALGLGALWILKQLGGAL